MPRLLPDEGVRMFYESSPPPCLVEYAPDVHQKDMMDLATGLIGAGLRLSVASISGPELGSPIPLVVLMVPGDYIRIFVSPQIEESREGGILVSAFSYEGDALIFYSREEEYLPYEEIEEELLYQQELLHTINR